jgi:hypothetical protein
MLPRIRATTDSHVSHSRSVRYDGGNSHLTLNFTGDYVTWPRHFSWIQDVVGNQRGINPTYHVTLDSDVTGIVDFVNSDGAQISQVGNVEIPIDPNRMHQEGLIVTPTAAQFSSWSIDAYNAFHDQIPREFSIGNFLYELRDIKGMIPKIERSITKTASSNFLAFEFGVKPFVGDVQKMLTLMDVVSKRLKHLRDTAGKEVDLRFSRKVEEPTGSPIIRIQPTTGWFLPSTSVFEFRRINYSGKFTASSKLIQNLENLNDMSSSLKAYASALGLNNPIAIAWEAIPYSFVVDWFFEVGSLIDTLSIQPFGGEWSLRNTIHSFKDEYLYTVYQDFFPNMGNTKQFLGTARIRRYSRQLGLPAASLFATDLTLTPKQQALSLALLNQLR